MLKAGDSVGILMTLGTQQGGAELLLQHLMAYGSKKYKYVFAFLQDGPMVEAARQLGYSVSIFPATRLSDPRNFLATMRSLRQWAKAENLRVIFSWMAKGHIYAAPAVAGLPVKTMWYQWGIPHGDKMDNITTLFPTSGICCCSERGKEEQDKLFPHRPTHVCYPGAIFPQGELIQPLDARRHLGLPLDVPIIGMVSRREEWKGVHVYVDAAKLVAASHPNVYFYHLGGAHPLAPSYSERIERQVAESGLGSKFNLVGQRPATEVPYWQAAADLIAHPVAGEEPFGLAVVEAMGMRKVVIASDNAGGPSEIIQNGINGLLVQKNNPAALAAAIIEMLDDPSRREAMAEQGYLRGRSFSAEAFANHVEELIGQMAS